MKRRPLDFQTFDEAIADVDRLHKGGWTRGGNWSLAQVCSHLALFVRGSLEGFTGPRAPWHLRVLAPLIVWWMRKKRGMPEGVKIPESLLPTAQLNEESEVEELKKLLQRFQEHKGPLHPSPFAGNISYETWRDLHLIHCAHHLSFLHPAETANK
jgi:uncharacterized protein DUF1569